MPTRSHLKPEILNHAVAVAMASNAPKKMGAILLHKKKIISAATNSYQKTHPVQYWAAQNAAKIWENPQLKKKIFVHCEIQSLINTKENADTIIVARVGGHGHRKGKNIELRMARPCVICETYLRHNEIKHVHYSTSEGYFAYEYWGD
jgi:deoxycytidylate deaminase